MEIDPQEIIDTFGWLVDETMDVENPRPAYRRTQYGIPKAYSPKLQAAMNLLKKLQNCRELRIKELAEKIKYSGDAKDIKELLEAISVRERDE